MFFKNLFILVLWMKVAFKHYKVKGAGTIFPRELFRTPSSVQDVSSINVLRPYFLSTLHSATDLAPVR